MRTFGCPSLTHWGYFKERTRVAVLCETFSFNLAKRHHEKKNHPQNKPLVLGSYSLRILKPSSKNAASERGGSTGQSDKNLVAR